MGRRPLLTLAVVAALALGALAVQRDDEEAAKPPTDAALQRCPPEQQTGGDRNSFVGELVPTGQATYVVTARLTLTGQVRDDSDRDPVSSALLIKPALLYGKADLSQALILTRDGRQLEAASRAGSRLVFKAYSVPDRRPFLIPVAVLRPDGRVIFVLFCGSEGDRAVQALQRLGSGTQRTPAEVLLELLRQPQGPEARAVVAAYEPPKPKPWEELPPAQRDYSTAPAAVRQQLHELPVEIIVPRHWRDFPGIVCTATPVARGHGCAAFSAFSDTAAAHLLIGATAQDGQPLLIVLTDDLQQERLVLGKVDEPTWRAALTSRRPLVLRTDANVPDQTGLLSRLQSGPLLEVQPTS